MWNTFFENGLSLLHNNAPYSPLPTISTTSTDYIHAGWWGGGGRWLIVFEPKGLKEAAQRGGGINIIVTAVHEGDNNCSIVQFTPVSVQFTIV